MEFSAGQRWTYRSPEGFEGSRIVVGAILSFTTAATVVCCAVLDAPQRRPDGRIERTTIPFLPMSEEAFRRSVVALDGAFEPPADFAHHYDAWHSDPRGLSFFTVPFEGHLDRMIALQMAEIAHLDPSPGPAQG